MNNVICIKDFISDPSQAQVLMMQAKAYAMLSNVANSGHYKREALRLKQWADDLLHCNKICTVIIFNPNLKDKKITIE